MNNGFRPIIKIAVAAAIAGVVVFLTTLAPQANAPADTLRIATGLHQRRSPAPRRERRGMLETRLA